MVKIVIDGTEVEARKNATILQACLDVGVEIPRFCYHERLSIAGNCRMCLVEVEKSPKPIASCAMPVMEGMNIKTMSPLVKKAREGVLEFLLVNHPLDCPICDQGGECDLQDLTMAYGSDRGRFHEYKRGVEDKNIGPLIKTIMTRCIHCTRCVRFATEIAGVEDLGTVGRGRETEISTYIEKVFDSELSGNVIDLCPVGALTSKPYAFTARPWELESTESIDVSDGVGSNIRIDVRGSEIMRILPRLNEEVNEEWLSDKARFSYDGLKKQRLTSPMYVEGSEFLPTSWEKSFERIKREFEKRKDSKGNIYFILGNTVDIETAFAIKNLANEIGTKHVYQEGRKFENTRCLDFRSNYLLNSSLSELEKIDFCLLVGTCPRFEASLLNVRLRKAFLHNNTKIASIGKQYNLTYDYDYLGNSEETLISILEGRNRYCKHLSKCKNGIILIGDSVFERGDGVSIQNQLKEVCSYNFRKGLKVGMLNAWASSVGFMDLGIGTISLSDKKTFSEKDLVYLCNVDSYSRKELGNSFLIYQGHHGDLGASVSDIILPGSAYTEKCSSYINLEGRIQKTNSSFYAPGLGKEDWKIIRALSEVLDVTLPYDTLDSLSEKIENSIPFYRSLGEIENLFGGINIKGTSDSDRIYLEKLNSLFNNFYLTDPICRSSSVMGRCSTMYEGSNIDKE